MAPVMVHTLDLLPDCLEFSSGVLNPGLSHLSIQLWCPTEITSCDVDFDKTEIYPL